MRNKIILAVAVIAILATAAMLFFNGKDAVTGEVVSVAVSEPKEGVQEVIIKFLPEGALEPVYIKAVSSTRVVTTSGKRFAVDYLVEGDVIKVNIAHGQDSQKIKTARKIVFIRGEN